MTLFNSEDASSISRRPATRVPSVLARKRPLGLIAALATALFVLVSPLALGQDDTGTPAVVATPAPDAARLNLTFDELNDSGVTGSATLFDAGSQTLVDLTLEGTGADHPAHIHEGTCDAIQPLAAWNLTNVGTDGTSTTLIDVPMADLLNGEYVIDLHLAPDQLGLLISCVEITGSPVNAEGTPVAVGGDTTPTETAAVEPTATEEATATETAPATEQGTTDPTATAETTVEPASTEAATTPEVTATVEPTTEPTAEATSTPNDGTGGMINAVTPSAGDGTDGGKGVPVTPLTPVATMAAVGGTTSGDGTNADGSTVGSGKGVPLSTSGLPAATGSGDSVLLPTTATGAIVWSSGGFALILMTAGWLLRRGEMKQAPSRWKRLGL